MARATSDKALKGTSPKTEEFPACPVDLKSNGSPKTPSDDPLSKRPVVTIKNVKLFCKDDDPKGTPERECLNNTKHAPHQWHSGLINHEAWCYGTGVSPSYYGTTYSSYSKPKTDYTVPLVKDGKEQPWREDYTVPLTVHEARKIAYHMHRDDKDKSGDPYHLHLEGVRLGVVVLGGGEEEQIAALFHDAVEDNHTTYDMLRKIGCTEDTLKMVQAVEKGLGEVQEDYLNRIIESGPGAMRVKLADLLHNTRHDRMAKVKEKMGEHTHNRLLKKYRPSIARLMLELGIIATEDDQKALNNVATKPVGSSTGTYSGTTYSYNSADGSSKYKGDNLTTNEWPAGWPSAIKSKEKGFSNKYLLHDGTTRVADKDKYYKVWSKLRVEEQQKPGKKGPNWTPASEDPRPYDTNATNGKPGGGTTGTTSTSSTGKKPSPPGKSYDIDQLFRGDWVTFWRAPVLTRLDMDERHVYYLLANGEIKKEQIKYSGAKTNRQVTVWVQSQWENDPSIQPYDVSEDDILNFVDAVNNAYKGSTYTGGSEHDSALLKDVDEALGGGLIGSGIPYRHDDGRECWDEYGMWWYHPATDGGATILTSYTECTREHLPQNDMNEQPPKVPQADDVPLCGNVAPHERHYLPAGPGAAGMDECKGTLPTCTDTTSHAAHWMVYGENNRRLCPGISTHTARAMEKKPETDPTCDRTDPHAVHWVEEDPGNPLADWRCPGVPKSTLKALEPKKKAEERQSDAGL